jgi:heme oxygenase
LHNDLNAAFPPSSLGAQRIAEDLRWLGAAVPDSWPALVKPPCCAADALGALYVLEGSALGGRVIGRHVSLALGVAPLAGGSFFCSATADEARGRWQTFCAILERSAGDDDAVQRVCSAAVAAFETLEVWLAAPAAPAVQEARFAA